MAQRVIRSDQELELWFKFMREQELPMTVSATKGANRSLEQNKLQRKWVNEIAEQTEQAPEQIRGYCKLHLGVPILRDENAEFKVSYDRVIKPLPYESKIACMMEPLDFPVTRLMTSKQKAQYLDEIYRHFAERGIQLTNPEELRYAA